jgi:hypothetical protein
MGRCMILATGIHRKMISKWLPTNGTDEILKTIDAQMYKWPMVMNVIRQLDQFRLEFSRVSQMELVKNITAVVCHALNRLAMPNEHEILQRSKSCDSHLKLRIVFWTFLPAMFWKILGWFYLFKCGLTGRCEDEIWLCFVQILSEHPFPGMVKIISSEKMNNGGKMCHIWFGWLFQQTNMW